MVDLIGEQRVHKIELERDHLRAEAKRIEIILTRPCADGASAIGRILPAVEEPLKSDSVGPRDERRGCPDGVRHGVGGARRRRSS